MAANDIIYLFNQPVQFYKQAPDEVELADGFTSWENTAYHKMIEQCTRVSPDYCHPVLSSLINPAGADALTFQFKAETTGSDLTQSQLIPVSSGTNDSTSLNFLEDSTATFITDGCAVDMLVVNQTDGTSSIIVAVPSETEIELADDIFLATGKVYYVLPITITGNWRYNPTTDSYYVATAAASILFFDSILTVGNWYKVTVNVTDITAGSIAVKLGNNTIATISSVGVHNVYGQCTVTGSFSLVASSTFVGTVYGNDLAVFELVTEYWIVAFDKETELIAGVFPWAETSDSLTIGNIFVNALWSDLGLECGKYILGVTSTAICDGEIVRNGTFTGSDGWALDPNISIGGGFLDFNVVAEDDQATNVLTCAIVLGYTYDVSFDITNIGGIQTGTYRILFGGLPVSVEYNAATQGTTTVTFSAVAPGNATTISIRATSPGTKFRMDNFSITTVGAALIGDMDGLSECYCVCDEQPCTVLVLFGSDQPTFGEFFDGTETMTFRMPGRLRNDTSPTIDFDPFKSTLDEQVQPYNNSNRAEEFATRFMPAWAHNTWSIVLRHPIIYFDGVLYVCTEGHSPNWGNDSELADGVSKVMKKNQGNLRNTY